MIFKKDEIVKGAPSYEELTRKMRRMINENSPRLITTLVNFWNAQENVITYAELEAAIENGNIGPEVIEKWQKEYSVFVQKHLSPIWAAAIEESLEELYEKFPGFNQDIVLESIETWTSEHAAELVTQITSDQTKAINAMIDYSATTGAMTPYELARAIRPLVGLTKPQAMANLRYYETLLGSGMSKDMAKKKALDYAAWQHRYRAKVIAEHELAVANRYGKYYGVKAAQQMGLLGAVEKKWITAGDGNVCEACKKLDRQQIAMDEFFEYKGRYILGPEGAHVHCRCILIYVEVQLFSEIHKYNPYHDSKGRFTTGGKASFFSMPKDSKLAAKLKEKEKNRSAGSDRRVDRAACKRIKTRKDGVDYGRGQAAKTKLRPEEADCIKRYTGPGYIAVNGYLRGTRKTPGVELKSVQQTAKTLSKAIQNSKTSEDIIVYRGITPSALGITTDKDYKALIGKTIRDKGFMSSSISSEVAGNFAKKEKVENKTVHGAVFEIAVPEGTNGIFADGNSSFETECEFIMQQGTGIKIVDVKLSRTGKPATIIAEYGG